MRNTRRTRRRTEGRRQHARRAHGAARAAHGPPLCAGAGAVTIAAWQTRPRSIRLPQPGSSKRPASPKPMPKRLPKPKPKPPAPAVVSLRLKPTLPASKPGSTRHALAMRVHGCHRRRRRRLDAGVELGARPEAAGPVPRQGVPRASAPKAGASRQDHQGAHRCIASKTGSHRRIEGVRAAPGSAHGGASERALLEPGVAQPPVGIRSPQPLVLLRIIEGSEAVYVNRGGVRTAFDQRHNHGRAGIEVRRHMKRR